MGVGSSKGRENFWWSSSLLFVPCSLLLLLLLEKGGDIKKLGPPEVVGLEYQEDSVNFLDLTLSLRVFVHVEEMAKQNEKIRF